MAGYRRGCQYRAAVSKGRGGGGIFHRPSVAAYRHTNLVQDLVIGESCLNARSTLEVPNAAVSYGAQA